MEFKILLFLLVALVTVQCYKNPSEDEIKKAEDSLTKNLEDQLSKALYEEQLEKYHEDEDESKENDVDVDVDDVDEDTQDNDDDETEVKEDTEVKHDADKSKDDADKGIATKDDDDETHNADEGSDDDDGPELKNLSEIEQFDSFRSHDPLWGRRWRFRTPRIRVPRVRVRFPRVRFPRIRTPRIRLPRIRLPRIRLPRLRRIRFRFRRIRLRLRRVCVKARICKPKRPPNPCPYSGSQVETAIKSVSCDPAWKNYFEPEYKYFVDEYMGSICQKHTVCASCANENPWTRATCDNSLNTYLNAFCNEAASQETPQDRPSVLKWCNGIMSKIKTYTRAKAYSRVFYCKCLPTDFNSDKK